MFGREKTYVILVILCLHTMVNAEQEAVNNLDIQRSMGKWYEIASIPPVSLTSFANTTFTFTLNESNGTIEVAKEMWIDGVKVTFKGITHKPDLVTGEAKFKVRFNVPEAFLSRPEILREFWILHVDENYQYSLIGDPAKHTLWILNRNPQLDEKTYDELVKKAKEEGYDVERLRKTPQPSFLSPPGSYSPFTPPTEVPLPQLADEVDQVQWADSIFGKH